MKYNIKLTPPKKQDKGNKEKTKLFNNPLLNASIDYNKLTENDILNEEKTYYPNLRTVKTCGSCKYYWRNYPASIDGFCKIKFPLLNKVNITLDFAKQYLKKVNLFQVCDNYTYQLRKKNKNENS